MAVSRRSVLTIEPAWTKEARRANGIKISSSSLSSEEGFTSSSSSEEGASPSPRPQKKATSFLGGVAVDSEGAAEAGKNDGGSGVASRPAGDLLPPPRPRCGSPRLDLLQRRELWRKGSGRPAAQGQQEVGGARAAEGRRTRPGPEDLNLNLSYEFEISNLRDFFEKFELNWEGGRMRRPLMDRGSRSSATLYI